MILRFGMQKYVITLKCMKNTMYQNLRNKTKQNFI